jgi:CheY-like chemotaxis protein
MKPSSLNEIVPASRFIVLQGAWTMNVAMKSAAPLFDRPAIVTGEDKLQTDIIADLIRGVVAPEVVRTREYKHGIALAQAGGFALHLVGWDKSPPDALDYVVRLRRDRDNRDRAAPVIILCAAPTANDYKMAQEAGATAVFAKPIALGSLMKLFEKVKADPRPFVDAQSYIGPCRRRAILSGGPKRRRADAATTVTSGYTAGAIKDAVILFRQVSSGDLAGAAETCARLQKASDAASDAPMAEALALIAPYLRGSDAPHRDSVPSVGAAAVVRLAQTIGADEAQRGALRDGVAKLARKVAAVR